MPQIRTRQLLGSDYPVVTYGSGLQSFMSVETVSGSPLVGTAIARALRGEQSLTILIDGDSNENIGASGYLSRGARNFSLLAAQDAGLVRSGFSPCNGNAGIYTVIVPVRAVATGGGNLTADLTAGQITTLTPKLPAAWLNASANPIYSVASGTGGSGIFAGLQAFGTNVDPKYGVGAGAETPWWNRTEGETFCDVYCLRCNETGYGAEIIVRVTPTDTLQGAVGPSPVVTYTSGSGGIPAATLTSEAVTNGTVVVVRVPVTFNNGGLKNCAQLNITGSGGKVAVCGVEFVRPNAKGLSFSVVSGRSGYKLANYVNDHAAAGPVYKVFADRIRADGGEVAYLPQACVNDAYVAPVSTATAYKAIVESRIAQVRQSSWLGENIPIILVAAPYRDSATNSADAQDAAYDQYPSALRDIATQNTSGIIALNARKYLHKLGLNRGSETVYYSGSLMTFPSSARGGSVGGQEGVDQWRLNALNPVTPLVNYSYSAGTIVSFPSLGTMLCTATVANEHPVAAGGANATKWQARRQWLSYAAPTVTEPAKTANDSITNGTNQVNMDQVHFGGAGMFKIRMAETTLILQAAAMLS